MASGGTRANRGRVMEEGNSKELSGLFIWFTTPGILLGWFSWGEGRVQDSLTFLKLYVTVQPGVYSGSHDLLHRNPNSRFPW